MVDKMTIPIVTTSDVAEYSDGEDVPILVIQQDKNGVIHKSYAYKVMRDEDLVLLYLHGRDE